MEDLEKLFDCSNDFEAKIKEKIGEIQKYYFYQVDIIKNEYKKIKQILKNEKNDILFFFENSLNLNINKLTDLLNESKINKGELIDFHHDIRNNYHGIVYKIEINPFLNIMENYNEKLKNIHIFHEKNEEIVFDFYKVNFKEENSQKISFKDLFILNKRSSQILNIRKIKQDNNQKVKIERKFSKHLDPNLGIIFEDLANETNSIERKVRKSDNKNEKKSVFHSLKSDHKSEKNNNNNQFSVEDQYKKTIKFSNKNHFNKNLFTDGNLSKTSTLKINMNNFNGNTNIYNKN